MFQCLNKLNSFEHEVLINRPPQVVYEALVAPQVLDEWWTQGTVIDLRVGGKFRLCWRNRPQEPDSEAKGQYLAIVPGQRLIWRWFHKDRVQEQGDASQVVINLERRSVGTVLTLHQSSPDDDGLIPGLGITWCEPLAVLKFYLEHANAYHISVVGSPKYLSKAMLTDLSFLK
jgi:uncharacterized protein YndB with AHSA1/START domain